MPARPLNDVVLVKPEQTEKRTPGGIYLPDSCVKKSNRATVLAIGPGVEDGPPERRYPPDCQLGDVVILSRYFGIQDTHDVAGEQFETVRFGEILGVIEPEGGEGGGAVGPG